MIKQIYCLQIWLLFLVVANAQSYGRHKHQQQYESKYMCIHKAHTDIYIQFI
jgi:hypothetical protein